MSDFHDVPTHPKARKTHICIACYYLIQTREIYTKQKGFYEGKAYTSKYHKECYDELSAETKYGAFEFTPGELDPPERLHKELYGRII